MGKSRIKTSGWEIIDKRKSTGHTRREFWGCE